jgi:hypothetical protein
MPGWQHDRQHAFQGEPNYNDGDSRLLNVAPR